MNYTLSVHSIDGDTIYEVQSSSKPKLLKFLQEYDHEGSGIMLVKNIDNPEEVYRELGFGG